MFFANFLRTWEGSCRVSMVIRCKCLPSLKRGNSPLTTVSRERRPWAHLLPKEWRGHKSQISVTLNAKFTFCVSKVNDRSIVTNRNRDVRDHTEGVRDEKAFRKTQHVVWTVRVGEVTSSSVSTERSSGTRVGRDLDVLLVVDGLEQRAPRRTHSSDSGAWQGVSSTRTGGPWTVCRVRSPLHHRRISCVSVTPNHTSFLRFIKWLLKSL